MSKQYFSRPATFCKNDPSGLKVVFGRFFLIFSGSNQPISISLCQSRVLIPKNRSLKRTWSHKFEEQSLRCVKVGLRMAILVGFRILKLVGVLIFCDRFEDSPPMNSNSRPRELRERWHRFEISINLCNFRFSRFSWSITSVLAFLVRRIFFDWIFFRSIFAIVVSSTWSLSLRAFRAETMVAGLPRASTLGGKGTFGKF